MPVDSLSDYQESSFVFMTLSTDISDCESIIDADVIPPILRESCFLNLLILIQSMISRNQFFYLFNIVNIVSTDHK